MLGWFVKHGIEPHISVKDMNKRDDRTFSREDFAFDEDGDVYVRHYGATRSCPAAKITTVQRFNIVDH